MLYGLEIFFELLTFTYYLIVFLEQGLADCKFYFSTKQHYTLQDVLVAQYVLNDGLLMRQNHGMEDEYHVDVTEQLQ